VIAALYVEKDGVYSGVPGVDTWSVERDARRYGGPWPVVAHPPCARWGRYWWGGPTIAREGRPYFKLGDDGGCFAAAIAAVRRFGGVLEHPEGSHAWRAFELNVPPRHGGWVVADWSGGWTCCVEQGWYGHRARKATWLYAHGVELPSLRWGHAKGVFAAIDGGKDKRRTIRDGICQLMSKRQRAATPIEFRDLLISIASRPENAVTYDHWKTTNPEDEWLGPEPGSCLDEALCCDDAGAGDARDINAALRLGQADQADCRRGRG
jgi:hypothetical protein